uniref:Uncharacterized protein n=1 Tax=Arundo donax TaxID=35708 RepID=A0A0A9T389_ARUDO
MVKFVHISKTGSFGETKPFLFKHIMLWRTLGRT